MEVGGRPFSVELSGFFTGMRQTRRIRLSACGLAARGGEASEDRSEMNQEQPLRGEILRQAGHAWQQAMAEVHALSQRDLAPRELFVAFLQLITGPLGSAASAVWLQTTLGQLELTAERGLHALASLAE